MLKNTVIDRCLKSDFKTFEQVNDKRFILRWGKKDEMERIYEMNELTGKLEFTGETRETDWCTYESGEYKGNLNTYFLDQALEGRTRFASVAEWKAMYDGMGINQERQVELLREKLLAEIRRYDKSEAVEDFTIQSVHLWLNSDMRAKVRENLETAQQKGEGDVILRYGGLAFPMSVQMGWQLYYAVLDYARATWDVTEIHLATAAKLTTVEEILAYDYTQGYPAKLVF